MMKTDEAKCRGCGKTFHIDQLDSKPELHVKKENWETTNWTRLECKDCYGPGFVYGAKFQHLNTVAAP